MILCLLLISLVHAEPGAAPQEAPPTHTTPATDATTARDLAPPTHTTPATDATTARDLAPPTYMTPATDPASTSDPTPTTEEGNQKGREGKEENGGDPFVSPDGPKHGAKHVRAHDGFHNIKNEPLWAHWNDAFTTSRPKGQNH